MWQCKQGKCVLVPSGPDEKKHLFAILLDPVQIESYGSKRCVIMVGVTSIRNDIPYDNACVLAEGDHPFIKHASYVDYRRARIEQAEIIEQYVKNGYFSEKEDCSTELLKYLIQGALNSRQISREIKKILHDLLP